MFPFRRLMPVVQSRANDVMQRSKYQPQGLPHRSEMVDIPPQRGEEKGAVETASWRLRQQASARGASSPIGPILFNRRQLSGWRMWFKALIRSKIWLPRPTLSAPAHCLGLTEKLAGAVPHRHGPMRIVRSLANMFLLHTGAGSAVAP
jgi:hypothetical protein